MNGTSESIGAEKKISCVDYLHVRCTLCLGGDREKRVFVYCCYCKVGTTDRETASSASTGQKSSAYDRWFMYPSTPLDMRM